MYNFYTAFVTISMFVFVAIYNTSFINVVTLGGTVLGSAVIGLCSALLVFLLHKLLHKKPARYVSGIIGCGCIIKATAACLPGWEIKPDVATALFMSVLCFLVTVINEYILNDKN